MLWARIDADWVLPDSNRPAWGKSAETRMELMIIESAGECKTFPVHYQTDAANPRFRSQLNMNLFRGLSQGAFAHGATRSMKQASGKTHAAQGMMSDESVNFNCMRHASCSLNGWLTFVNTPRDARGEVAKQRAPELPVLTNLSRATASKKI